MKDDNKKDKKTGLQAGLFTDMLGIIGFIVLVYGIFLLSFEASLIFTGLSFIFIASKLG